MVFRTSESIDKIAPALIKASASINHAQKDADNSHFKNSYATLEASIDACKAALLEQEIIVMQAPSVGVLTTRLLHSSGQFKEFDTPLHLSKNDMQGYGSAVTYARRQSLTGVLNMSQKDDDGNEAAKKLKAAKAIPAKKSPVSTGKLPF